MRNFCLTLILLVFAPSVWFSSCSGSDDSDDGEAPTVSNIRFNFDDTISHNGEIIKINDSKNMDPSRVDTLVIGKMVYLTAHFQDNVALSSYKVILDSVPENRGTGSDSAFTFKALGADIFGYKDTVIARNNLITIPNNLVRPQKNDILQIREGEYSIQIACGDRANKVDSTSYIYKVKLFSRETIYNIRKGITP